MEQGNVPYLSCLYRGSNILETPVVGIAAGLVDFGIGTCCQGVLLVTQSTTLFDHLAAGGEAVDRCGVFRLVDDLDPVTVVEGHLGVKRHLREYVDAAVDNTNCVERKGDDVVLVFALCVLATLAEEVVGEGGTVVTAVGLRPDAEFVGLGLIFGEPARVRLVSVD